MIIVINPLNFYEWKVLPDLHPYNLHSKVGKFDE